MREQYLNKRILASTLAFCVAMVFFGSIPFTQVAKEGKEIAREGRFIAYGNGTVLDTKTGLMWAAKDDGKGMDEQDARAYFENYRAGGYTDWRMPINTGHISRRVICRCAPPAAHATAPSGDVHHSLPARWHVMCRVGGLGQARGGCRGYDLGQLRRRCCACGRSRRRCNHTSCVCVCRAAMCVRSGPAWCVCERER